MRVCIFVAVLSLFLSGNMVAAKTVAHFLFSSHQTYAKGTIRPSQQSVEEQDAAVAQYYDVWKAEFLVKEKGKSKSDPPGDFYRVAFGKSKSRHLRTVSEGQGYGMLIVPLMAGHDAQAREIFDGLWRFSRAHPSGIETRLMEWEIPSQGGDTGDSAFDGDMDIAYGLLLADKQWGSAGAINYRVEALKVIAGIQSATIGPESHLPLLGDWVAGTEYTEWQTRTSDFMPGHFRAFGRATGDPVWRQVTAATLQVTEQLQSQFSTKTGLLPDFVVPKSLDPYFPKPAPPKFLEEKSDGAYAYNACRTPWRLATDVLLNDDVPSCLAVQKMSHWIEQTTGGDPQKIRAGYALNGKPLPNSDYFCTAFVAPFGVAAMLDPSQQAWLDNIYAVISTKHQDYYEDSITLLSLLAMTGHFWDPTLVK